ncbi:MAG: hypothetical protein H0X36_13145 [Sphingomonadaceae bacterium]|nr:hypothetical protein [Sphingomonadaceae bacterium]
MPEKKFAEPDKRANAIDALASDIAREHRAKAIPPEARRLVAEINPALEQEVLDIAQRQREPDLHHHHQADNFRRRIEVAKRVGGFALNLRLIRAR